MSTTTIPRFPALTEYQVTLHTRPTDGDDEHLDNVAAAALETLNCKEGPAVFALGPVASINLDSRQVEILVTVEAADQAELHQKVALIAAVLERNEELPLQSSETTETEDGDLLMA